MMRPQRSEASSNPESPVARSNDSGDGSQKTSVRKDRPCPFCRQPFTSSSLGRHLDLYIKEKNPKAPDGIHDVEQIKKLRGKITRRHARVSSSAPNGMNRPGQSPSLGVSTMKPQPLEPRPLASEGHAPRSSFSIEPSVNGRAQAAINKLNWQATGVINDLPPRPSNIDSSDSARLRSYSTADWSRSRESAAAETALKDVLNTIRAAYARAQDNEMFEFDAFSMNFPGLCLRVLPPPTTLFSSSPIANAGSWPLRPPQENEYRSLQDTTKKIIEKQIRNAEERGSTGVLNSAFSNAPTKFIEALGKRSLDHLDQAFTHWKKLSSQDQQELWQMEIMRAFATEKENLRDTKETLSKTRQECDHLKQQLDAARDPHRSMQQHMGLAQMPSISSRAATELVQGGLDVEAWDFEAIMTKYRSSNDLAGFYASSPLQQRQGSLSHSHYQQDPSRRQSYATPAPTSQPSTLRHTSFNQAQMGHVGRGETDTEMNDREVEADYGTRRNLGAG